jgi:hypothetical protein
VLRVTGRYTGENAPTSVGRAGVSPQTLIQYGLSVSPAVLVTSTYSSSSIDECVIAVQYPHCISKAAGQFRQQCLKCTSRNECTSLEHLRPRTRSASASHYSTVFITGPNHSMEHTNSSFVAPLLYSTLYSCRSLQPYCTWLWYCYSYCWCTALCCIATLYQS